MNLTGWFKRHLAKKQSTSKQQHVIQGPIYSIDMKFLPAPALKEGTIQQLQVLIRGQPDPTPDVLKVWSQLLHVPQDAIVAHLRSESFEDYEEQFSPLNHLPTPVSASPEPYYDNIPYKSDPTHSPTVPTFLSPYQHERIPHVSFQFYKYKYKVLTISDSMNIHYLARALFKLLQKQPHDQHLLKGPQLQGNLMKCLFDMAK